MNQKVEKIIEKTYEDYIADLESILEKDIIGNLNDYYPNFGKEDAEYIRKVFWFGEEAHRKQRRFSGEPYYIHPVMATKTLMTIKPDIVSISACLLHDVIEDTPVTGNDIEKIFGQEVRFLCEGVEKITKIRLQGKEREYESLRKLFVAMAKDIRVIFIKLADRIHNLSTLEHVRPEKQLRIAQESIKIYAPVAEKLGLFDFKTQIEDFCLSYIHPIEAQRISQQIKKSKKEQKKIIEQAKKEIHKLLIKEDIKILKVEGRTKNSYSIYEKMKRKNFSEVSDIYDLFAIRALVESQSDCYRTLGAIHANWKPIPKRFKDYVAVPKQNGYQSLHTTVLGLGKNKYPTEIQIRTEKMHLDAEYGPAAHWAYKKAKNSRFDTNYIKKMNWFPQNINLHEESSPEKFFKDFATSLSQDRILVFTPKGEAKDLPIKSSPIDFAYAIHSDIGANCIGAKVNGTIKPLNFELKSGDVIHIMTKTGKKPNPLWLNFVKSSHAKTHIKNYINKIKQNSDTPNEKNAPKTIQSNTPQKTKTPPTNQSPKTEFIAEIIIGGEVNIPYKIVSCCNPKPGKDIIAYNSRGLDFTIHEAECKTISKLDPSRFVEALFRIEHCFQIKANDRIGLLRDYTNTISTHGLNITDSKFSYDKTNRIATWQFAIECSSDRELNEMISELKEIPNVFELKPLKKI